MDPKYLQHIAKNLNLSIRQIANIFELQSHGATIPFIARYRKEATGNLDEVVINRVVESIIYFLELEKRKETIIKTIDGLGKLNEPLKHRIEGCFETTELEDIYLPYKPKRKTRAAVAIEKGLESLAKFIFEQTKADPEAEARKYCNEFVKEIKEAIEGARDIIAEWISENEHARNLVRRLFAESAILTARVMPGKKEEAETQRYRDYFDYREPLKNCPSHRLLAIRRGEKEGFLLMGISIEKEKALEGLEALFIKTRSPNGIQVKLSIGEGFERLLAPSIENEFRLISKNKADKEAISVFAENLRQLLLAPPLGSKRILAIDPGFRSGCKIVCLDEQGNFLFNLSIYPHPPQNEKNQSVEKLKALVNQYHIQAIGIGNGTAGRETEHLIREIDFGVPLNIFMVNENGASIYSASELAREEFPDEDVTVRGAISIGRRLLDPLSELVKLDPKSIGVGQYQHDVNQHNLKDELDRVVESCVNHVGVELNTASRHLLNFVSGLSKTLAKNIVEYRLQNGAFQTREELKKVSLMGPKTFEQCAGFLRINGATDPLDNSAVHPESYFVVGKMANDLGCTLPELIRDPSLRKRIDKKLYISATTGEFTIEDILKELEKPGRDPRKPVEEFKFDERIKGIDDLETGMIVPGIITNITKFGVFVDIGVKQDGLVHISQLSRSFISDPGELVKLQQRVTVSVLEIDKMRKRIALSMKGLNDKEGENAQSSKEIKHLKPLTGRKNSSAISESETPFQARLADLKNKFNK